MQLLDLAGAVQVFQDTEGEGIITKVPGLTSGDLGIHGIGWVSFWEFGIVRF